MTIHCMDVPIQLVPIDEYLGCVQSFATTNDVAMNSMHHFMVFLMT